MRAIAFVAAYLAYAGQARRVQTPNSQQQVEHVVERVTENGDVPDLRTVTAFLLAFRPSSAFTLSGPGMQPVTASRNADVKMSLYTEKKLQSMDSGHRGRSELSSQALRLDDAHVDHYDPHRSDYARPHGHRHRHRHDALHGLDNRRLEQDFEPERSQREQEKRRHELERELLRRERHLDAPQSRHSSMNIDRHDSWNVPVNEGRAPLYNQRKQHLRQDMELEDFQREKERTQQYHEMELLRQERDLEVARTRRPSITPDTREVIADLDEERAQNVMLERAWEDSRAQVSDLKQTVAGLQDELHLIKEREHVAMKRAAGAASQLRARTGYDADLNRRELEANLEKRKLEQDFEFEKFQRDQERRRQELERELIRQERNLEAAERRYSSVKADRHDSWNEARAPSYNQQRQRVHEDMEYENFRRGPERRGRRERDLEADRYDHHSRDRFRQDYDLEADRYAINNRDSRQRTQAYGRQTPYNQRRGEQSRRSQDLAGQVRDSEMGSMYNQKKMADAWGHEQGREDDIYPRNDWQDTQGREDDMYPRDDWQNSQGRMSERSRRQSHNQYGSRSGSRSQSVKGKVADWWDSVTR